MERPIIIDTADGIEFAHLCARRGALRLEILGLHRRGRSAYSICKEVYGLKGSRQKVLDQLCKMIDEIQAKRRSDAS